MRHNSGEWTRYSGRRSRRAYRPRLDGLEGRRLLAAPVIEAVAEVAVPAGKTVFVPIRGSDADGDAITYTATSSDANTRVVVRSGRPFLRMTVAGRGDLVFQLFDDLAPETVRQITTLANNNFYDNLTFHRIVPDFVIQGGDPAGNGSGGPGFSFADEFNPAAIFSGSGQLAMANSGRDTNGSQFFVTIGNQRSLDFNHTIFGQLVRGADVVQSIVSSPRNANDRPTTPIVIEDVQLVANTTDTVLQISTTTNAGPATITVTATDPTGSASNQTFTARSTADTVNDPPILGPVGNQQAAANSPLTFTLSSTDLEGDAVEYQATVLDASGATATVAGSSVTLTPRAGFTGAVSLRVGVKQQGATRRGSSTDPFDTQVIQVNVVAPTLTSMGLNQAATARQPLAGSVVATFTASPTTPLSTLSAQVDWGDGTSSAGTVAARAAGGFEVRGTHTYAAPGDYTIRTTVTGPAGATSAATSTAVVQAAATSGPVRVAGFARTGILLDPTVLVVSLTAPLDPDSAEDVGNYVLRAAGDDGRLNTSDDRIVPIESATYDDEALTVTLTPTVRLRYLSAAQLRIRSSADSGVRDADGNGLDGDRDDRAGGDAFIRFARGLHHDLADGPAGSVVRREDQIVSGPDLRDARTPRATLERYREDAGAADLAEIRRRLLAVGLFDAVERLAPLLGEDESANALRRSRG